MAYIHNEDEKFIWAEQYRLAASGGKRRLMFWEMVMRWGVDEIPIFESIISIVFIDLSGYFDESVSLFVNYLLTFYIVSRTMVLANTLRDYHTVQISLTYSPITHLKYAAALVKYQAILPARILHQPINKPICRVSSNPTPLANPANHPRLTGCWKSETKSLI
jgi:hypothetical protein